jgi:hypothetical protein
MPQFHRRRSMYEVLRRTETLTAEQLKLSLTLSRQKSKLTGTVNNPAPTPNRS